MRLIGVALAGATGRMGRALVDAIGQSGDMALVAALCPASSPLLGQQVEGAPSSPDRLCYRDDVDLALAKADVLIDFSVPAATLVHLAACQRLGRALVIGTTGFDAEQKRLIDVAATSIGIVSSPNMSVGVNLSMALLDLAARTLPAQYDVEILEMHHRHKIDAPSGTALKMGEVIAHARGTTLDAVRAPARDGRVGQRTVGQIGFAALRGGDVIGEHTVIFAGDGERIEVSHRSSSRRSYAEGSLIAARYLLSHRRPGLFDMRDVLGLEPL